MWVWFPELPKVFFSDFGWRKYYLSSGKVAVSISVLDQFGENKSIIICKNFRNGTDKDLKNLDKQHKIFWMKKKKLQSYTILFLLSYLLFL